MYVLTICKYITILSKIFSTSSSKDIKTFFIKLAYIKAYAVIKLAIPSNLLPLETL